MVDLFSLEPVDKQLRPLRINESIWSDYSSEDIDSKKKPSSRYLKF